MDAGDVGGRHSFQRKLRSLPVYGARNGAKFKSVYLFSFLDGVCARAFHSSPKRKSLMSHSMLKVAMGLASAMSDVYG